MFTYLLRNYKTLNRRKCQFKELEIKEITQAFLLDHHLPYISIYVAMHERLKMT
jgi:hypothetical protein